MVRTGHLEICYDTKITLYNILTLLHVYNNREVDFVMYQNPQILIWHSWQMPFGEKFIKQFTMEFMFTSRYVIYYRHMRCYTKLSLLTPEDGKLLEIFFKIIY